MCANRRFLMPKILFLLIGSTSLVSSPAFAGRAYHHLTKGLPKDVVRILDRRIHCNYLAGEMPAAPENPSVRHLMNQPP